MHRASKITVNMDLFGVSWSRLAFMPMSTMLLKLAYGGSLYFFSCPSAKEGGLHVMFLRMGERFAFLTLECGNNAGDCAERAMSIYNEGFSDHSFGGQVYGCLSINF